MSKVSSGSLRLSGNAFQTVLYQTVPDCTISYTILICIGSITAKFSESRAIDHKSSLLMQQG